MDQEQWNTTRITAHRYEDEPYRLIRVAKAVGIIEFMTMTPDLLLAAHDRKGTLSINWRTVEHYRRWKRVANEAWEHLDGAPNVEHFIRGRSASADEVDFHGNGNDLDYPGRGYTDCYDLLMAAVVPDPRKISSQDAHIKALDWLYNSSQIIVDHREWLDLILTFIDDSLDSSDVLDEPWRQYYKSYRSRRDAAIQCMRQNLVMSRKLASES